MDWTFIGNPGNACDTQSLGCFGAVSYGYNIGTYEVTNAQYAEFLNARAQSDPSGLYNTNMGTAPYGGITRSGISGSFTYTVITGRGDMPVNYVQITDAMRFANWMSNGQGTGSTETGSYTLGSAVEFPTGYDTITRNAGATIVLASENEWYKAAYYNAATTSYFDYEAGSNTSPTCSTPTATANRANCNNAVGNFTNKGSYTGSPSPYGTFDQAGNAWEFTDTITGTGVFAARAIRGGGFNNAFQGASLRTNFSYFPANNIGFRLVMIPEPGTGALLVFGLAGLARRRSS